MKFIATIAVLTVAIGTSASAQQATTRLDATTAGRFAALALACVQKEYPNKISHVLNSADDVKAPHELTPERPYGLAWLLQLGAELRESHHKEY